MKKKHLNLIYIALDVLFFASLFFNVFESRRGKSSNFTYTYLDSDYYNFFDSYSDTYKIENVIRIVVIILCVWSVICYAYKFVNNKNIIKPIIKNKIPLQSFIPVINLFLIILYAFLEYEFSYFKTEKNFVRSSHITGLMAVPILILVLSVALSVFELFLLEKHFAGYFADESDLISSAITEQSTPSLTVAYAAAVSEADELRKLKELLDSDIITSEEYEIKKKQILKL